MSDHVAHAAAARIGEYARHHGMTSVLVIFHGGEPLLVGHARLRELCRVIKADVGESVSVEFGLQTNGTLIDPDYVDVFREYGIRVGVSIDGPPSRHDRHRVHPSGRGSSAEVEAGIKLLRAAPAAFGGVLCVIDVESDPIETYEYLVSLGAKRIDFLLPDGHHAFPPPQVGAPADAIVYSSLAGNRLLPMVRARA